MTAVSFVLFRNSAISGASLGDFAMKSITVGSNAPSSGDFEFRFNVLDGSAGTKNINDLDIIRALKMIMYAIETGGGSTGGNGYTSVTQQPSGPPN